MTGILQNYARKHNKAIDYLKFKFQVYTPGMIDSNKQEITSDILNLRNGPSDGIYVYGMFLESARWDPENQCLVE